MPWNKRTLALPASPPSVRLARDWVSGVLREIGHSELADSARLAVSELVTNAILHAEPPMTVTVRGTPEHPRIEVTDQSLVPPQRRHSELLIDVEDDRSWATVGRGLDLVASYSVRWGADISPNGLGKVVWFEPSDGVRESPTEGEVFTMDAALADLPVVPADPSTFVRIQLLGMPVDLFAHLRRHFNELGRELRLLAITDGERYPLAVDFSEAYLQVEYERRQVSGLEALEKAIADGTPSVDLTYVAPPTAPETMARLSRLLVEVYDQLSGQVLLSVRPPDYVIDMEKWYFGEFRRQADGEEPIRWDGPLRLVLPRRREVS
ncbi:anti-sigma regulatory factor (Ser/Thr protein kinase) [Marmoricola sp. URHA0025 HA25]